MPNDCDFNYDDACWFLLHWRCNPFSVGFAQCKPPSSCPGDSAVTKCGVAQEAQDKSETTYTTKPWHVDIYWVSKFTSRVKLVINASVTVMFHFMDFLPSFPVFCSCFLSCSLSSIVDLIWLIVLTCFQFCSHYPAVYLLHVSLVDYLSFVYKNGCFWKVGYIWSVFLSSRDLEHAEGLFWPRTWCWQLHTA